MNPKEVEAQLQRVTNLRAAVAAVYGENTAVVAELMFFQALSIGLAWRVVVTLGARHTAEEMHEELAKIAAVSAEKVASALGVRNELTFKAFESFDQLLKEILS